jgi:hypothetical protein
MFCMWCIITGVRTPPPPVKCGRELIIDQAFCWPLYHSLSIYFSPHSHLRLGALCFA